ncbi:HPr kinase/phosphatase C-terminal domain-containing protein [Sphingomonas oligophenolica]|uniref:Aldolase n=1 Tax=Sphingomonas oligophenolica TaxID=301154 RepID=A0ABU9YCJ0_9SPHN
MSETIHASTVAIDGHAVLLEGPSGAGKSDLALRLIDRGAVLVSDDYTLLTRSDGLLLASPPATIAGRIEVRGVGILPLPHAGPISVAMIVRLDGHFERLPEPVTRMIAGVPIPEIAIDPREHSAPIKVELALRHLLDGAT